MATGFNLTDEQQLAVDLAQDGGSISIQALAGAGKTSTLREISLELRKRHKSGLYMAFNKSVADDAAASFPDNVEARTAHSLAIRSVGVQWCMKRIKSSRRVSNADLAAALGYDSDHVLAFGDDEETIEWPIAKVAGLAHRTVEQFCRTADDRIRAKHVPKVRGLDIPSQSANMSALSRHVVRMARIMWKSLTDESAHSTPFRFTHGVYLKMWQLSEPVLYTDFVLFDEAQDANPVMFDVVESQKNVQQIWVGDVNQRIYEWNGAIDAMSLASTEHECSLTQSFRFGPEIAEQANIVLGRLDSDVRVIGSGKPGKVDSLSAPDAWLGRTNSDVVGRALALMADGIRVAVQGGTGDIMAFARAAQALQEGRPTNHVELESFKTWEQVQDYVDTEEGEDLGTLVRMVDNFGTQRILNGLADAVTPSQADVMISTAHKSKGAEWGSVGLMSGFTNPVKPPTESDLRLLYVAVTRAMTALDRTRADLEGWDIDPV